MIRASAAVLVLALSLAGCGGSTPAAPTVVTVTATAPAPTPATVTAPAPALAIEAPAGADTTTARRRATVTPTQQAVTLPAVKGRNGAIVADELRELGLTKVRLASGDPSAKVVILPENWTAMRIEPPAGSKVGADDTVVVTMTKS